MYLSRELSRVFFSFWLSPLSLILPGGWWVWELFIASGILLFGNYMHAGHRSYKQLNFFLTLVILFTFILFYNFFFTFSSAQMFAWYMFLLPFNLGLSQALKSWLQPIKVESYILVTLNQHWQSRWIKFWRWYFMFFNVFF